MIYLFVFCTAPQPALSTILRAFLSLQQRHFYRRLIPAHSARIHPRRVAFPNPNPLRASPIPISSSSAETTPAASWRIHVAAETLRYCWSVEISIESPRRLASCEERFVSFPSVRRAFRGPYPDLLPEALLDREALEADCRTGRQQAPERRAEEYAPSICITSSPVSPCKNFASGSRARIDSSSLISGWSSL